MKARIFVVISIAASAVGQPALAYQGNSADRASCDGVSNLVCVAQVGSGNAASVGVLGQGNNGASIAGAHVPLTLLGSPRVSASPLTMSALPSGVVSQTGDRNVASVDVAGDSNRFHVAQTGSGHLSLQTVQGSGNVVAAEQGQARGDLGNTSIQTQNGFGNVMRLQQFGSANTAVQTQGVSAEAALIAGSGLINGVVFNNNMLLQQNGSANEAYLAQVGAGNSVALRQQGGSQISVTQLGNGHSLAVEQPYGQRGVQIIQY